MKRSKFGAVKTLINGIKFDSKKEALMYQELLSLEKDGKISDLKLQQEFLLQDGYRTIDGRKIRPIKYLADFTFYDNREKRFRVIDCKGFKTEVYKIKKKLLECILLSSNLYLEETI
jgi:hypothetical protein